MQKSITSYFFDFIFCAVLIFFISFIWLRFYIHNSFLLYLISIIITLALSFLIYLIFKKKVRNFKLNKKEKKDKEIILNSLIFENNSEIIKFLSKFYTNEKLEMHRDFIIIKSQKTLVVSNFCVDKLNLDFVLNSIKRCKKEKCERVIIFTNNYTKEIKNFVNNIRTIDIKLINFDVFYTDYILKEKIYPHFETIYEEKKQYKFKELLSIAFKKEKTKNYLLTGIMFLVISIFTRYNIYYIIFTTIMFAFAIFSYFNKFYNLKE